MVSAIFVLKLIFVLALANVSLSFSDPAFKQANKIDLFTLLGEKIILFPLGR